MTVASVRNATPKMSEPIYCPAGPENGCEIYGCRGTCPEMADRANWRFCRGYGSTVCRAALAEWRAAGEPRLTDAELLRVAGERENAPESGTVRSRQLDDAFDGVPSELDGWEIYAPHARAPDGTYHDVNQTKLRRIATEWLRALKEERLEHIANLVLLGDVGVGKTFLAKIVGALAFKMGRSVRFTLWRPFVLEVKESRSSESRLREDEIIRRYCEADLLILDDLRVVFNSQDDENIAHEVFSRRYGERDQAPRPVILTANLSESELEGVIGAGAMRRLFRDGVGNAYLCDWPPYERGA